MRHVLRAFVVATGLLALAACGGDDADGTPRVMAATSILGDLVEQVAGEQVEVEVLIPATADPHDYQLSAREQARLREADAIVINGGQLNAGLERQVGSATGDGVPTFLAFDAVEDPLTADGPDHDHGDHDHDHGELDPHFFGDPRRTVQVVEALGPFLADAVEGLDRSALDGSLAAYVDELHRLDAEVEDILGAVPAHRRVLVTNHLVLGYFADRYGFEVAGTIHSGAHVSQPSARDLVELRRLMDAQEIDVVFTDVTMSANNAEQLADSLDVEVVALHSESLGEEGSGADTYVDMVRANARSIASALAETET